MSMVDCRCEPRPRRGGWILCAWLVVACKDDGFDLVPKPPPSDPTFGAMTSSPVTGSTSDSGDSESAAETGAVPCGPGLDPCAADSFCSAPVIGATPAPGEFECGACLEPGDSVRWCLDAASCCDPAAGCENGFCGGEAVVGESSSSGSGSSDTGGSSSDSSSDTSGSSDSSSSGDSAGSTSSGDASSSSSDSTGA
jgi:hypothetical protein